MRTFWRLLPILMVLGIAPSAAAAGKKSGSSDEHPALNACGCYQNSMGVCVCKTKGKCECPGECEPKGCEEKRARQMEKEVAAETKKAAEADRKARQTEGKDDTPEDPPRPKARPLDKDGVGQ